MLGSFKVPGYGLTVSNTFQIASEDLSGNSSSTATAENGFKPKVFAVSTTIRFSNKSDLTALVRIAEGVDGKGQRTIYTAANGMLEAMNVRRVRFTDTFSATPADGIKAWNVSFSLREYDSTAERMEARTAEPSKNASKGSGNGVLPGALDAGSSGAVNGYNTADTNAAPTTDTEKVLQNLDSWLGGSR